jgi:dihydrofolate synthase/folylpolyglutamate synthase
VVAGKGKGVKDTGAKVGVKVAGKSGPALKSASGGKGSVTVLKAATTVKAAASVKAPVVVAAKKGGKVEPKIEMKVVKAVAGKTAVAAKAMGSAVGSMGGHVKGEKAAPVATTLKPAVLPAGLVSKAANARGGGARSVMMPSVNVLPRAASKPAAQVAPPTPTGTNTLSSLTGADVVPNSAYGKALKFLATLSDYEHRRIVRYNPENFNLDRMRALLKRVGDPHTKFRSVHVAGTKGKGSTCAMITSMVQANGYKTALYTSPHLVDIRERIQINGEMISREDFVRLVKAIEPHVHKLKPQPTYFDVLTAIAFMYFAEQKVELAVVEVGLGGRLDSTNVITPEVTAVTSISMDHMQQLGHTVEKIAGEKAGIFKHGVPALTCQQSESVEGVLKHAAEKVGAPFDVTGKTIEFSYRFESSRLAGPHFRMCLTTPHSKFEHLAVPMVGEHQAVNCGLALAVIDRLKTRGIALSDSRCIEGLAKAYIPGRMELVNATPRIIVDGAHNAASIDALIKSIGQHVPYDSMVLIFGCCGDKDVKGMLEKIAGGADKVIFTKVNNIRSSEPEELAHKYNEMFGKMCQVSPTLEGALAIARRAVTKEDLICITGSFYLVGEAKRMFPGVPSSVVKPAGMSVAVASTTHQNLVAAGAGA